MFLFIIVNGFHEFHDFFSLSPDEPDEPDGRRNVLSGSSGLPGDDKNNVFYER